MLSLSEAPTKEAIEKLILKHYKDKNIRIKT